MRTGRCFATSKNNISKSATLGRNRPDSYQGSARYLAAGAPKVEGAQRLVAAREW